MHKLKEMLMEELYEYEEKAKKATGGKISMQELEKIHKLTDTVKNICKIDALEEGGGYSEESRWMADGKMYGTSYDDGTSYARGRGRNAKRDSMGRYSSEGESYRGGSSYDDGMSYEGSSYARGGNRGGNTGGRGGYSREGAKEHMIEKMEEMMEEAESPKEREAIRQCIHKLENA